MSAESLDTAEGVDELPTTCVAPSCWRDGEAVLLQGSTPTVLCRTHRKLFFGVST